ncbi:MAG: preprotein translocase subunit SecA [Phycisphaeraceae bacterium]|nr:preprotein translocase subunit SecA [Phycisphaeraceae bacterium]
MPKTSSAESGIPLIGPILNRIIGTRNERFVKRYTQRVEAINALEAQTRRLTDEQIRGKYAELRVRAEAGAKAPDLLVEAFAVAREAMDRAVGIRNVFNPRLVEQFDVTALSAEVRAMHEQILARIAELPVVLPRTLDPRSLPGGQPPANAVSDERDEFLGCTEPIQPWMYVEIPPEFYEAVRAVCPKSKPPFRARPFDVQLIGGMVLSNGKIAEMKTGEGKTIVGPLACYLACIEGLKVHVVTVNDYLVQRDRDWTYPYFRALGLTVGAIHPMHMQPEQVKREMYRCSVVYGTTAEFGFDYLRDNMKRSVDQQVQRRREFAIVDEVDSILIDEARTPLIISGAAHEDAPRYDMADRLARQLVAKQKPYQTADDAVRQCTQRIRGIEGDIRNARDKAKIPALQEELRQLKSTLPELERERAKHTQYYEVEMDKKRVSLSHDGIAEAQRLAGVGSLYVGENMDLPHLLEQAVRAHVVYQRDRDYIVMPTENPQTGRMEPSIVIVDVNTGRPMVGRQWSDGLHQACEVKEGVPIKQETQTVATVTIQNFFKMYKRLAGMTGTADTEAQEFHDIYRLDVVAIPTNVAVVRADFDDMMFLSEKDKWDFIVDEIKSFHDAGRPVLVGTTSVEKSETLSRMLSSKHGIKHEVLNAKQHEREAHIVENAGQLGAVMIATNMAGRGTDIKLGSVTRETILDHWLKRGICSRELTVEATDEQVRENIFRKIGARELDLPKHEVEKMEYADLERGLLQHWAVKYTWLHPGKIEGFDLNTLRTELDRNGRFLLHRVRWFTSVEDLGGLHVIGTERHESRRIDNQLRGRSGRQGDNGSSRFFVSLQDDLMKLFAGDKVNWMLSKLGMKEGDAIESPMLSKQIERAQRKVEERNFQVRKNILDYDEVMEHQRRSFYGLRQRVLEGRDVRGIIMDYIADSVEDAVATYLDRDYAAQCAAEFVRRELDISIEPDRLRGLDSDDLQNRIRKDAVDEYRAQISVTLGEYLPTEGSEFEVDFDAEGLARWARSHFGVEFSPNELREKGAGQRREIQSALEQAAAQRIAVADLSGLNRYADPAYGAGELARWAETKFGIKIDPSEVLRTTTDRGREAVSSGIVRQAEELYRKREVQYPVDFAMNMTMQLMRQNPAGGAQSLVNWANQRFALGWTAETMMRTPPQQCRQQLLDASERFVESGELDKAVEQALACKTWDDLQAHFKSRFSITLPDEVRRLEGQERDDAVRARVESIMRAELLYMERTMLLETLDTAWKDHLYSMDQLRDSIGFRAFSQQDPRIEYKREGSRLFNGVLETIRDRVTDLIFKIELTPQIGAPQAPRPGGQTPPPQAAPSVDSSPRASVVSTPISNPSGGLYTPPSGGRAAASGTATGLAGIMGPGLDIPTSGAGTAPTSSDRAGSAALGSGGGPAIDSLKSMSDQAQRDLEAAQRAGTNGERAQPVVKSDKRYGRNDACPQGSGRKYKKCCNRPDGTCTGEGMNAQAGGPIDKQDDRG